MPSTEGMALTAGMVEMLCDTVAVTPSSRMSLVDSCPPFTMNRFAVNESAMPLGLPHHEDSRYQRGQIEDIAAVQREIQNALVLDNGAQRGRRRFQQLGLAGDRYAVAQRADLHHDVDGRFLLRRKRQRVESVFPETGLLDGDTIASGRQLPDQIKTGIIRSPCESWYSFPDRSQ